MGAADILGNEGLETISRSPFFEVGLFCHLSEPGSHLTVSGNEGQG